MTQNTPERKRKHGELAFRVSWIRYKHQQGNLSAQTASNDRRERSLIMWPRFETHRNTVSTRTKQTSTNASISGRFGRHNVSSCSHHKRTAIIRRIVQVPQYSKTPWIHLEIQLATWLTTTPPCESHPLFYTKTVALTKSN